MCGLQTDFVTMAVFVCLRFCQQSTDQKFGKTLPSLSASLIKCKHKHKHKHRFKYKYKYNLLLSLEILERMSLYHFLLNYSSPLLPIPIHKFILEIIHTCFLKYLNLI